MIDSPLDILFMLYIALTQSIVVPTFGILITFLISKFDRPTKDWYYDKDKNA